MATKFLRQHEKGDQFHTRNDSYSRKKSSMTTLRSRKLSIDYAINSLKTKTFSEVIPFQQDLSKHVNSPPPPPPPPPPQHHCHRFPAAILNIEISRGMVVSVGLYSNLENAMFSILFEELQYGDNGNNIWNCCIKVFVDEALKFYGRYNNGFLKEAETRTNYPYLMCSKVSYYTINICTYVLST